MCSIQGNTRLDRKHLPFLGLRGHLGLTFIFDLQFIRHGRNASNLLHLFNFIFLIEKEICLLACGFKGWRLANCSITWKIPPDSPFEVTNIMTGGNLGTLMNNDSFKLIRDIGCCGSFDWRVAVFWEKYCLLVVYQVTKFFTIIVKSCNLNAQWWRCLACEQPLPCIRTFWASNGKMLNMNNLIYAHAIYQLVVCAWGL